MGSFFDFLAAPFGMVMRFIYDHLSFNNYGLAIIVFTAFTRLLMFPLNMKQYKNSARMQQINPQLEDLRKKYGNDKQRLNEETMKLYQEEKINPMSGCLPLLIQMPILLSLYRIITGPMKYMLEKTPEQIAIVTEAFREINEIEGTKLIQEIEMLNFFRVHPEYFSRVSDVLNRSDLLNMNFLGIDLSRIPSFSPGVIFGAERAIYLPLLLIPIIGVVVAYFSTKISMVSTQAQTQNNPQAASMNRTMMLTGPVMTLIFSFQLPGGVLLYWIAGYGIQIVQQLFVNKYIFYLYCLIFCFLCFFYFTFNIF